MAFKLLLCCWMFALGCCSSPEWFRNISTNLFNLPGDILLGGLFPINHLTSNLSERVEPNHLSCESLHEYGLGLALVMKYAVDEINANQVLLPGIRLGYDIFDTCSQSAVIVKPTVSFLSEKSTGELVIECNYTSYEPRVAAVIGPSTSEMASVIGSLLGFFLMPQISYGATSTTFNDKKLYPSFLRTVPDDKLQVMAMVHLLAKFKWNWVALVGSDDTYGRQGLHDFSNIAERSSICIAYKGLIPVYMDPYRQIKALLDNIITAKVGVVVVFSLSKYAKVFYKEVIRSNFTCVWIASTAWALDSNVANLPNIHKVGTIIGFTDSTQTLGLFTSYAQELFTKISMETKEKPTLVSETNHLKDPCPQCRNLSPANMSLVKHAKLQHTAFAVYAAIYCVAQALHTMLNCNISSCGWGADSKIYPWQLLTVLKNVSLDLNGIKIEFDSSGNPHLGYNLVEWVWDNKSFEFVVIGSFEGTLSIDESVIKWHTKSSKAPSSTCSSTCERGQVQRVKGFHSCCFDCIDCTAGTFQKKIGDIQCKECPKGQWSLIRSTNCTDPTFDHLAWSQPESLAMMLAGAALLACHCSVGILYLKHWGTPLVRASGGALSAVALLSLMGGCLSLLLFLGQPGNVVCRLQMPLNSIFPTGALSTITLISIQMFYVTEFHKKAAHHLNTMRRFEGWLVLACCCVQAGICGGYIWNVPLLSHYLAKMDINFVRQFLSCPVELLGLGLMQGFNGALALISFMCTFMAIKPVRQYNLARDITFSTMIYCLIWVTFIPIYTSLSARFRSIVYVSFSLGSNMGLLVAYYFPKCHLLLRKPELNTSDYFRSFLEGAPPTLQEDEQSNPMPQTGHESEPHSDISINQIEISSI